MGKARIIAHIGDALYRAQLLYDSGAATQAFSQEALDALAEKIVLIEAEIVDILQPAYDAALKDLDKLIYEHSLTPPQATKSDIESQQTTVRQAQSALASAQNTMSLMRIEYTDILIQLQRLAQVESSGPLELWCADYSTSLSGIVDTIEIDGEPQAIVIAPSGSRELIGRKLQLPISMSPAQAAFNWAILPGWQRHRPTYRAATVIKSEYDDEREIWIFEARLDEAKSVAQALPINPPGIRATAEIEYMACGARSFRAGDRVIIEWPTRDFTQATVIGFLAHPRPCDAKEHLLIRMNNVVTVWCPEDDTVVLEPCEYGGVAYDAWWDTVVSRISDENPYSSIKEIVIKLFGGGDIKSDDYTDDTRPGKGKISSDIIECVNGTCGHIYAGAFTHNPPSNCEPPTDPDVEEYERAFRSEWVYRNTSSPNWVRRREEAYPANYPAYVMDQFDLIMHAPGETIEHKTTGWMTDRFNSFWPCGKWRYDLEAEWDFTSFGGHSMSGIFQWHKSYYDSGVWGSYILDWRNRYLTMVLRTDNIICQFLLREYGRYDNGVNGTVHIFCAATSDWLPGQAKNAHASNRAHNSAFAACVSALYRAARSALGLSATAPANLRTPPSITGEFGVFGAIEAE